MYILGSGSHANLLHYFLGGICLQEKDAVPQYSDLYIGVGDAKKRDELFCKYFNTNKFPPFTARALIFDTVLQYGCHVMPNAILMPGVYLKPNVLINTGAQIDHDCTIHESCVISPGAILCGNVVLGYGCEIGAGAIIVQGVTLNAWTRIPAGSLVVGQNDIRRPQRMAPTDRQTSTFLCENHESYREL